MFYFMLQTLTKKLETATILSKPDKSLTKTKHWVVRNVCIRKKTLIGNVKMWKMGTFITVNAFYVNQVLVSVIHHKHWLVSMASNQLLIEPETKHDTTTPMIIYSHRQTYSDILRAEVLTQRRSLGEQRGGADQLHTPSEYYRRTHPNTHTEERRSVWRRGGGGGGGGRWEECRGDEERKGRL